MLFSRVTSRYNFCCKKKPFFRPAAPVVCVTHALNSITFFKKCQQFPQQDLQTCQRGKGPTRKSVNGLDKRSRRTIYRVHTPPQNLARHCVGRRNKKGNQLKRQH